jgi:hypothetical protein
MCASKGTRVGCWAAEDLRAQEHALVLVEMMAVEGRGVSECEE